MCCHGNSVVWNIKMFTLWHRHGMTTQLTNFQNHMIKFRAMGCVNVMPKCPVTNRWRYDYFQIYECGCVQTGPCVQHMKFGGDKIFCSWDMNTWIFMAKHQNSLRRHRHTFWWWVTIFSRIHHQCVQAYVTTFEVNLANGLWIVHESVENVKFLIPQGGAMTVNGFWCMDVIRAGLSSYKQSFRQIGACPWELDSISCFMAKDQTSTGRHGHTLWLLRKILITFAQEGLQYVLTKFQVSKTYPLGGVHHRFFTVNAWWRTSCWV